MHKLQLLFLTFLFLGSGISQQEVKVKNPMVYTIGSKTDSLLTISPPIIELEIEGYIYDSCDFYNNLFEFEFELRNNTDFPVICNKTLICWYDCGISLSGQLNGEALILKPRETQKVKVKAVPYNKKSMNSSAEFILIQEQQRSLVPIHLKFTYSSMKSCSKQHSPILTTPTEQ